MANICSFNMLVVGNNTDDLTKFVELIKGTHEKFYLCGVRNLDIYNKTKEYNDLFTMQIVGDVSWSIEGSWMMPHKMLPNRTHNPITLADACKMCNVAVEIWSSECGIGFQEHTIVNNKGVVKLLDTVEWTEGYYDDDENLQVEESGGFDDFCNYADSVNIFQW